MSNIIPFVSSTPPPLDEDQTFGWEDDDDDDDFGNFASAPAFSTSASEDPSVKGDFVAQWPSAGDTAAAVSGEREACPGHLEQKTDKNEPLSIDHYSSEHEDAQEEKEDHGSDGADGDFADFATFQGDTGRADKPHIDALPLKTTHQQGLDEDVDSDSGAGRGTDTVMEKSRESTTTDSGLFSTDMSPLPQSESLCISEGDKTMHSDDEMFSDMPQDSQPRVFSHTEEGHVASDPDPSQDEDSQSKCEDTQMLCGKKPGSRQSDRTLSPDENDEPKPVSEVTEMTENETASEVTSQMENEDGSENDNQHGTDTSLCQNTCSGSASLVEGSIERECEDSQELSSISDTENHASEGNAEAELKSANDDSAIEVIEHCPSEDVPASVNLGTDEILQPPQPCSESKEIEEEADDDDWAAFETSPPFTSETEPDTDHQRDEPEDLVLRKDSIHFDDEENMSGSSVEDAVISEHEKSAKSTEEEGSEEDRKAACTMSKSSPEEDSGQSKEDIPEDLTDTLSLDDVSRERDDPSEQSVVADTDAANEPSDIPPAQSADSQQTNLVKSADDSETEDDGFGNFQEKTVPTHVSPPSDDGTKGSDDGEDFANFSPPDASHGNTDEDFGDFSSSRAADVADDDDDDFGDFSAVSGAVDSSAADKNDLGAFSDKAADAACEQDDFGNFSGQPSAVSDSGWADFSQPAKPSSSEEDFGNFSSPATDKPAKDDSSSEVNTAAAHVSVLNSGTDFSSQNVKKSKAETALKSCFPSSGAEEQVPSNDSDAEGKEEVVDVVQCSDKSRLGVLETILEYGLQYRTACQQTWQVVQHPSRNDPRVKLWGQLQDMDGSPAVVYQWGKSSTNSHLFHTLHIDTQNMLVGHKKRSVPIFATGLSLLEPIRGGKKGRDAGGSNQPDQGAISSMLSPTLVDPSSVKETEQRTQEIPAVDFDWSSSGLTNPLTSHSLDLDFLVGQDMQSSDKPSDEWDWVFQSELLDAPRSNVKTSQPLEDILRNVKPTSVRSRRDDAATAQMSSEAVRVLSSLPDLSFMQSKVLMFPIKN